MRRYGRYLLWLTIVAGIFGLLIPEAKVRFRQWLQAMENADPNTLSAKAVNSLVYPVNPGEWLTFSVPDESRQLRIITNAHIKRADSLGLNPNWAYAIRYEMLDKDNQVVHAGLYHQYSRITRYTDEKGGLVYNNYYADKELAPLDGRLILFGLQGIKKISTLRLKLEAMNPAVIGAAIRVYVPVKIAEQRLATEWLRMKQTQRENLAKNSIYPASLLSPAEKKNLVKHQWQPLGPLGVVDKNYRTRILYTLNDVDSDTTLTLASGLQADNRHLVVIPLPENGGEVELSLKALDGGALAAPVELDVQWFGRSRKDRWQKKDLWSNDTSALHYRLAGGLLVVRPASPVIVAAFLTTATEAKRDISDVLLSIKSYHATLGVDFDVLHFRNRSSALRVDVRRIVDASPKDNNAKLLYQWLNSEGRVIADGELAAPGEASLFDRIAGITEGIDVSDAVNYYLHVPPDVVQIRFTSDQPGVLVSVYNQPYGFTKTQMIPEDLYQGRHTYQEASDTQLSWFPVPASNEKALLAQQGVQWISGQYHPSEDKPDVTAGDYLWQEFFPQTSAVAHYVLAEYTGDQPRAEALPSIYCEVTQNRSISLQFAGGGGLKTAAPELIYLRDTIKPFKFELLVNGHRTIVTEAMGKQGLIKMPEMALSKQTIRLNTNSGGRWLVNYRAQCDGQRYLKRRVFTVDANRPLDFRVEHKGEDDVFTARLFTLSGRADRSQLSVKITPESETNGRGYLSETWTYTQRLYDIRPLTNADIPVLYEQDKHMHESEQFAIPLNSDLPPGFYRIRIASEKSASGLIMLSQIQPGQHNRRRFYREINLEHP